MENQLMDALQPLDDGERRCGNLHMKHFYSLKARRHKNSIVGREVGLST